MRFTPPWTWRDPWFTISAVVAGGVLVLLLIILPTILFG